MRQITQKSVQAFLSHRAFNKQNMSVEVNEEETKLKLHGNTIAILKDGRLFITNCGWESTTTKERLNALPNVHIQQKNWIWYLTGSERDGELI